MSDLGAFWSGRRSAPETVSSLQLKLEAQGIECQDVTAKLKASLRERQKLLDENARLRTLLLKAQCSEGDEHVVAPAGDYAQRAHVAELARRQADRDAAAAREEARALATLVAKLEKEVMDGARDNTALRSELELAKLKAYNSGTKVIEERRVRNGVEAEVRALGDTLREATGRVARLQERLRTSERPRRPIARITAGLPRDSEDA